MIRQSLAGEWQLRQAATNDDPLPARVPGGVHLDLLAAGRIPDPFVADNELRVQWVAEQDWEYRRTFVPGASLLAGERQFLVADGLDTLAEVRLNGRLLGETANMFRSWRWDVTGSLREGENEIVVTFRSAVRYAAARNAERPMIAPPEQLPGAPYLRKAPCHFGWDWGPKLPNVGIWQEIRLEAGSIARLADVHLRQRHEDGAVTVTARIEIERWEPGELTATLRLEDPDGRRQSVEAPIAAGDREAELSIEVADPRLWWPNGYGGQPLYRAEVSIERSEAGSIDRQAFGLGLRTIELRQAPDEFGRSFMFVVNGVPVFAKGSNWIPADSFPTRVSDDQLEALLGAAAAANHNMVRIWGGGYYESEAFFDLCDRLGLLVWQDFMFACSAYPLADPRFLDNVRIEVEQQVRRLRHRASLALWCGNNEIEAGWSSWGWSLPDTQDLKAAYERFFSHLLPDWLAADDTDTAYWPSSPSSGEPFVEPIGDRSGDQHQWTVWHGLAPFASYRLTTWRFVSEFGFESVPSLATIRTFAPDPADWDLESALLLHHQRCPSGNARIRFYVAQQFRPPRDFESMVYVSQVLQAEAMRVGVEHWRRGRDRCSGTLYWQLNDCWPVSSWSSVDYFGRWKALQYASRRFYAPVLLSGLVRGSREELFVTNDLPEPWRGKLRWSLESFDGEVLEAGTSPVDAPGLATAAVATVDLAATAGSARRRTVVVAELWQGGTLVARRVEPLLRDKRLELREPRIEAGVEPVGAARGAAGDGANAYAVRLRADTLARFVELSLDGADTRFEDNYVDLPAGREVRIAFEAPDGWDARRVRSALRVRSLFDSYE